MSSRVRNWAVVLLVVAMAAWAAAYPLLQHSAKICRLLDQASAAMQSGRQQEVESACIEILKLEPQNAQANELLGAHFMQVHDWPSGAAAFGRLEKLAPRLPHVLCREASCYLRGGDEIRAYRLAEDELKRDPKCLTALGIAAHLAQEVGQDAISSGYYRRMAEIVPDDPDVLKFYGESLLAEYRYADLKPVVKKLLAIHPDDSEALDLLGESQLRELPPQKAAENAAKTFLRSVELDPVNPGARLGLGRAYLALNRPVDAVFQLHEAERLSPDEPGVYFELGRALAQEGQAEPARLARARFAELKALSTRESLLRTRCITYPKDPSYPRMLGLLLAGLHQNDIARIYLQQSLALNPHQPDVARKVQELASSGRVTG